MNRTPPFALSVWLRSSKRQATKNSAAKIPAKQLQMVRISAGESWAGPELLDTQSQHSFPHVSISGKNKRSPVVKAILILIPLRFEISVDFESFPSSRRRQTQTHTENTQKIYTRMCVNHIRTILCEGVGGGCMPAVWRSNLAAASGLMPLTG